MLRPDHPDTQTQTGRPGGVKNKSNHETTKDENTKYHFESISSFGFSCFRDWFFAVVIWNGHGFWEFWPQGRARAQTANPDGARCGL
jgi:hypothetical protein